MMTITTSDLDELSAPPEFSSLGLDGGMVRISLRLNLPCPKCHAKAGRLCGLKDGSATQKLHPERKVAQ